MTASQLDARLRTGKSDTLGFKKSTAEEARACRTLCAFASGRGGRVLLGVTTAGRVNARVGTMLVPSRHQVGTKLGPSKDQVGTKLGPSGDQVQVLELAGIPRTLSELMMPSGRTNGTKFRDQVLRPLLDAGLLEMTIPDRPRSPKQQYRTTSAGVLAVQAFRLEPH